MLKTKKISLQRVVKVGGRSRPRRSTRACNGSSVGASNVFFLSACGEGVLAAAAWIFEVEALRLRLLDGRGDSHDVMLKVRGDMEGDRLLDDHWRQVDFDGEDIKFCKFQGRRNLYKKNVDNGDHL